MWYSPQQHCQQPQPLNWHGYNSNLSTQQQQPQQQQRTYSRTAYYSTVDESSAVNRANTHAIPRNNKNESFIHYNAIHTDDVNVASMDYHNISSAGSYSDDMSSPSLPYQTSNTYSNPVITASTKAPIRTNSPQRNHTPPLKSPSPSPSSSSSSTSGCWDWLLYSPEIYSHLYIPSSSFVQQQQQDDDLDLLARLPTWLLALLYPSMKQYRTTDDQNDNDQEISSLNKIHNNLIHDEALISMNIGKSINQVSSNLSLSSENTLNSKTLKQNRSTTPDTDDGYQSASDASRSDCSQQSSVKYDHHNSKDDIAINPPSSLMPKRISYAAAVKPISTSVNNITITNNKMNPLSASSINKAKNNDLLINSNETSNNNGQKLKFVAPRFERMHHAKQYSCPMTTTNKDSSSSSTSLTNRSQMRSNNNNNQRNHANNSARRR